MSEQPVRTRRIDAIAAALRHGLDGARAVEDVRSLTAWNRTPGSSGYRAAAAFVAARMREAGLDDVAIDDFPMDGRARYRGWTTEPAWDLDAAELRLTAPIERKLADWRDEPIAWHQGSWGTPEGGIEATLMDVDDGTTDTAYADRHVAGCIVLASGTTQAVYEQAVRRRGALGILSHHMPWTCPEVGRTPGELPDLISQGRIRIALDDRERGFAVSISHRQAEELRQLLKRSEVTVNCRIVGGPRSGAFDVVTGRIPGAVDPDREVIVLAHLCHPRPGANDNASGVALGLEIARCLAGDRWRTQLGKPPYTVRFLFVPEIIGGLAFLDAGRVDPSRLLGGVNLDMVGAKQSVTRSPLLLENTPWSLPTYAHAVADRLLIAATSDRRWSHRAVPFEGGSDNVVFNDATVGAPMIGFGYRADPCYHSNRDVWQNMDPRGMVDVGIAAGGAIWIAAAMDPRLADEVLEIVERVAWATPPSVQRETVESVRRRLPDDPELDAVVERHLAPLQVNDVGLSTLPAEATALARHCLPPDGCPLRKVNNLVWPPINGVGEFTASLPAAHPLRLKMTGYDYVAATRRIYEILNLSDGHRSWLELCRAVIGQFAGTALEDVAELGELLLDVGAITSSEEEPR